ncbi:hypothetical protein Tiera_037 [Polaromonas phage Tiera]|nr:hypothetical protein Tiera_037 [Polaromonas phage Tiera]
MAMDTIEFVIVYKEDAHETQKETVRATEMSANTFAFEVESNGGVAVVLRRVKPNGRSHANMWID